MRTNSVICEIIKREMRIYGGKSYFEGECFMWKMKLSDDLWLRKGQKIFVIILRCNQDLRKWFSDFCCVWPNENLRDENGIFEWGWLLEDKIRFQFLRGFTSLLNGTLRNFCKRDKIRNIVIKGCAEDYEPSYKGLKLSFPLPHFHRTYITNLPIRDWNCSNIDLTTEFAWLRTFLLRDWNYLLSSVPSTL